MEEALAARKEKILSFFTKKKQWIVYLLLGFIAWLGYYIRTRNVSLLIDATTNDYFPADPDAIGILRYVRYIVEHGSLMNIDYMRFFPTGFGSSVGIGDIHEFSLLSHLIVYFYKFLHLFNSAVTVQYADVIYPAVAFVVALLFFFLLLRKLFDWKVALLASAFLTVLPSYLFRTMSGVSDKEAMAMIFFYAALYCFISLFLEKDTTKAVAFSISGGIASGCLWALWGGVSFLTLTLGTFMFVLVLLEKVTYKTLWLYTSYVFFSIVALAFLFPLRAADPLGLVTAPTSGMLFLALAFGWTHHFLFIKDFLKLKARVSPYMPCSLVTLGVVFLFGLVAATMFYGWQFIPDRIANIYINLVKPFGTNRWVLTVAESRQPYFVDIVGEFTWKYLLLVFGGAVLLFFEGFKGLRHFVTKKTAPAVDGEELKQHANWILVVKVTLAFALFLAAVSMNRYSGSASIFNGTSNISLLVYLGSLVAFVGYIAYILYSFYKKDAHGYHAFAGDIPLASLFVLIFFFYLLVGARSAVRLIFVFAPVTTILASYFLVTLYSYATHVKEKIVSYGAGFVLLVFAFLLLNGFAESSLAQAVSTGMGYDTQWQYAMDWVRENTPEDAVFAHWWDYGYYVQTGGERATVSDGGNAHPAINYFIGRYFLTGQNDTEALQILAAKNVTHVLVVSDEIGKYSAYSSIGSDANYDRFSWIPVYGLDMTQTQETDTEIHLAYVGGTALDEDFVYNNMTFPANQAGVAGFIVPATKDNATGTITDFQQPQAVLVYNNQLYGVPMRCLFVNGEEKDFGEGGMEGCVQIIPVVSSGTQNNLGGAIYISPRVLNTWFARYYLLGEISKYFTIVYNDAESVPLMLYNGRLVGPLKIWSVSYPDTLEIPEEYYGKSIPEEVTKI